MWLAGRRVPRFLPLVPARIVAPTLALYGTGSAIYALAAGYTLIGLGGAASLAFGAYGWALAVAAVSYQRRSRPVCVPRNPPVSGYLRRAGVSTSMVLAPRWNSYGTVRTCEVIPSSRSRARSQSRSG